jgi:type IV pilus assembly protein PilA
MRYRRAAQSNERGPRSSRGFSLIELLIVVAIILIIAAIAIPNLMRSRIAANEASAVENIRTITTAADVYNTTYQNGFPPDITVLGNPGNVANADCNDAILVQNGLTQPPATVSGFTFAYTGGDGQAPQANGCANQGFWGYLVTATPVTVGVTGGRSFCSNEPANIYYDPTGNTAASEAACLTLTPLQ